MNLTNIVGYLGTVIGTFLMLPQVIKSFRTKKAGDLSMAMVILYVLNSFVWLVYGLLISSAPLVVANGIVLVVSIIQLILKVKYLE